MKAIFAVIGAFVLIGVVWSTFFSKAPAQATVKPAPVVNSATVQGHEPWMANERTNARGRDIARKSALEGLGQPWANYCAAEGRKLLIDAVNYYYGQRHAQIQSYERTYGEDAKRFVIKAWSATADDNRIERLTRETYSRGYFSLDDVRPTTRAALAEIVKGERVTGKPCRS